MQSYVMLFANATPLLALIALVHNIVDLRMTAKTVLNGFRRPLYACANDIGVCSVIIDIATIMSIIVNSSFVAFGNNALMYYFPTMNEYDRVVYCVVMEVKILKFRPRLQFSILSNSSGFLSYVVLTCRK